MLRVMIFIDGSWLTHAVSILREKAKDPNLRINYGSFPQLLAKKMSERLKTSEADVVRVNFFASIPINVHPKDLSEVEKQQAFYEILRRVFHYETEIFEIDFQGRRLHPEDRDPSDPFTPREKCVDVALASSMLYYAAINAYDVAIPVIGDADYIPVLQYVHRLGKRIMITSVHGSCCEFYDPLKDPTNSKGIRDIDTLFLDEIIEEIRESPSTSSTSRTIKKIKILKKEDKKKRCSFRLYKLNV